MFISFEGIDGSGKSLQVNLLAKALVSCAFDVYLTKEPGDAALGSNIGAGVRELLFKNPGTKNIGPGVADLLFMADHLQNTYDIQKALDEDKIVVTDRYADSQFAYAEAKTRKATGWANDLYRERYGPVPDLTFLFVLRGPMTRIGSKGCPSGGGTINVEDISWALARANNRHGAEEKKQEGKTWNDVEEQRKIQNAYIKQIGSESRTHIINVWEETTPMELHVKIMEIVLAELNKNA
jgi:dTMP kinase